MDLYSQLEESAMKKNKHPLQSLSLVIKKKIFERILSNNNGYKKLFLEDMFHYFSYQETSLGVQFDNHRKYTWNCFMTITRTGDGDCFLNSIK